MRAGTGAGQLRDCPQVVTGRVPNKHFVSSDSKGSPALLITRTRSHNDNGGEVVKEGSLTLSAVAVIFHWHQGLTGFFRCRLELSGDWVRLTVTAWITTSWATDKPMFDLEFRAGYRQVRVGLTGLERSECQTGQAYVQTGLYSLARSLPDGERLTTN
ncbi:hypothetical protein CC2G_002994 [Coprinopsis cinerea AmutBmut pab1-1]|nr:hypothetical protein CC2G_002994 [Coprinopsis cinerea AmutBmut pab1-1]